jgi:sulfite reductase alpha subunit-like flavoprotein
VTYDLRGTGLTYKTAHNLAFFPENSDEDIDEICKTLKVADRNTMFIFKPNQNMVSRRATAAK